MPDEIFRPRPSNRRGALLERNLALDLPPPREGLEQEAARRIQKTSSGRGRRRLLREAPDALFLVRRDDVHGRRRDGRRLPIDVDLDDVLGRLDVVQQCRDRRGREDLALLLPPPDEDGGGDEQGDEGGAAAAGHARGVERFFCTG